MIRRGLFGALLCAVAWGAGPALSAGDYFVQLASVKSDQSARKEWVRLQKVHAELLGDLALDVQRADLGDRGIFYRIRMTRFMRSGVERSMAEVRRAAERRASSAALGRASPDPAPARPQPGG